MGAKKRSNSKQQPLQKRATTEQHTAYHKAKISPENLFTTADIKQLFDISESSVKRWRKNRVLPYVKLAGTIFYLKDIIIKILEERIIYPD